MNDAITSNKDLNMTGVYLKIRSYCVVNTHQLVAS
jgi:hypothetical protein